MKITSWFLPAAAGALAAVMTVPAFAQANDGLVPLGTTTVKPLGAVPGGTLVLPTSSLPKPAGQARTHLQFVVPYSPLTTPPFNCDSSPTCETPASLACVYLLPPYSSHSLGCDPNIVTTLANGGSRAIGIVDAFHDKNALADLQAFSAIFGLPSPNLTIIKCTNNSTGHGTCSTSNPAPPACQNSNQCGWAIEESLDLQAAHAMAPHAKIILVEAHSDSFADLFLAEKAAGAVAAAAGGGEVSNSWGGSDGSGEQAFDSFFVNSKVVFLASTGDQARTLNRCVTYVP
jgi:kumamolisin